jgi:hypothetical protein
MRVVNVGREPPGANKRFSKAWSRSHIISAALDVFERKAIADALSSAAPTRAAFLVCAAIPT